MAPLAFAGTPAEAMQTLVEILEAAPRVRLVAQDDRYLHAEFVTKLLRFVDDVEFLLDEAAGVIHFRSASRAGHWDLGANRRRMERIRHELQRRLVGASDRTT